MELFIQEFDVTSLSLHVQYLEGKKIPGKTSCKVLLIIDYIAAKFCCLSSHKLVGNKGIYTLYFINLQRKEFHTS